MANVACLACGMLNRSGANFCKKCGIALNTQMPVPVYQPAPSQVATRFLDNRTICRNALSRVEHNVRARWFRSSDYNQMCQMLKDLAALDRKIEASMRAAYRDFQESVEGVRLQESDDQKGFDLIAALSNAPMLLTPPNLLAPSVGSTYQRAASQNSARRREILGLVEQYNHKITELHSWRRRRTWPSILGLPDTRELPGELDFKEII